MRIKYEIGKKYPIGFKIEIDNKEEIDDLIKGVYNVDIKKQLVRLKDTIK